MKISKLATSSLITADAIIVSAFIAVTALIIGGKLDKLDAKLSKGGS